MGRINVITVDGPSASGKGSLARKIAQIFENLLGILTKHRFDDVFEVSAKF